MLLEWTKRKANGQEETREQDETNDEPRPMVHNSKQQQQQQQQQQSNVPPPTGRCGCGRSGRGRPRRTNISTVVTVIPTHIWNQAGTSIIVVVVIGSRLVVGSWMILVVRHHGFVCLVGFDVEWNQTIKGRTRGD